MPSSAPGCSLDYNFLLTLLSLVGFRIIIANVIKPDVFICRYPASQQRTIREALLSDDEKAYPKFKITVSIPFEFFL